MIVAYLVNQIVLGKLTYSDVVAKRPDLIDSIDTYILENNINIDKTL